jgi:hypothetical protein
MLDIIGGSYHEMCIDPSWDELYGSGFRAAVGLSGKEEKVRFHTYADAPTKEILELIASQLNFETQIHLIDKSVQFVYSHPLANPYFSPDQNTFSKITPLKVEGINHGLCFGMIEGNAVVKADKIVYDPQKPLQPVSFSQNGSLAKELIYILNINEAHGLCGSQDIDTIRQFLINKESCYAAIIKNGAHGATLIENSGEITNIPSFKTQKVWPIGSGDIYSAAFTYEWLIKKNSTKDAAFNASLATANFANTNSLPIRLEIHSTYTPFISKADTNKSIYLAGPFFNMGQRWMIDQCRQALLDFGFTVFSPLHDVGIGKPEEVVVKDIEGLRNCDAVFAIVDGLDSGTMFELGYAKSLNKKIICLCELEKTEALTMLIGTGCLIEADLATAIYKTVWITGKE